MKIAFYNVDLDYIDYLKKSLNLLIVVLPEFQMFNIEVETISFSMELF